MFTVVGLKKLRKRIRVPDIENINWFVAFAFWLPWSLGLFTAFAMAYVFVKQVVNGDKL